MIKSRWSDIKHINYIGKGAFGAISKISIDFKEETKTFALKEIFLTNTSLDDSEKEFSILKDLSECENIVKVYGSRFDENENIFSFVMDLYDDDLKQYMEGKNNTISKSDFLKICCQLVNALAFLSKTRIIYKDLKPSNILVNDGLRIALCDFGVAERLDEMDFENLEIAGTINWMSPELRSSFKNNTELKLFEDKELTIKTKIKIKTSNISTLEVFSFGLVLLWMTDPVLFGALRKTKNTNYNQDSNLVKNFMTEKREFLQDLHLFELLERALSFDPKLRPDFIEIEDIFLYSLNCPWKFFTPVNIDGKYQSLGGSQFALSEFTSDDIETINSNLFKEKLYFAAKVPDEYLEAVIKFKGIKDDIYKIYKKYKEKYAMEEKFSEKQLELRKKLKREPNGFENLILLYTLESNFYKELNSGLSQNMFKEHSDYIEALFFQSREEVNKTYQQVKDSTVYRVCKIYKGANSENSRKTRLSYFPGICWYWPSFTSTSKRKEIVEKFARAQINFVDYDMILFRIKLNVKNTLNKFDISTINPYGEEEILLFPYFRFTVVKVEPQIFKVNSERKESFMLIDVEELDQASLPVQLLWFDPNMDNEENKKFQRIFTDFFKLNPCYFINSNEEAIDIVKKEKNVKFLIISCGSSGKEFIDRIYELENVYKICLFCMNKELHSKWFNEKNYHNFLGIFTKFSEIVEILPKYAY